MTKNNNKNYFVSYDYMQQYHVTNLLQIPKITKLTISLYPNEDDDIQLLSKTINQIKYSVLFYCLLGRRPKLEPMTKKKKLPQKADLKYSNALRFSVKRSKEVHSILDLLSLRCSNLEEIINNAKIINNRENTKSSIILNYPLTNFNETLELDQEYDLSTNKYHFSVRISFNQIMSKAQISSLI